MYFWISGGSIRRKNYLRPQSSLELLVNLRIGIYISTSGGSIGGAELSGARLAEALAQFHQVEMVHHRPSITTAKLETFFNVDLSKVRLRSVALEANPFGDSRLPWRRYQEARAWHRTLSEGYDLFINFTHQLPPFCHARIGVLMVLFPLFDRHNTWPWGSKSGKSAPISWESFRQLYYDWEWRRRVGSYHLKLANSQFTKGWTKRRWDIESEVIYPPVDSSFERREKENLILSVGRFATAGHSKKQVEMVNSFQFLITQNLENWEYFCVGGLGDSPAEHAYFEKLRAMAEKYPIKVLANIERCDLKRLYERSKVFWHAAGYNHDSGLYPELEEHFGISTVEAMAAGCIPIVVKRGGQSEIVEHGVSGFLWDTVDELRTYTMLLARNEQLRAKMSKAARVRSQLFSKDRFVNSFLKVLSPFIS